MVRCPPPSFLLANGVSCRFASPGSWLPPLCSPSWTRGKLASPLLLAVLAAVSLPRGGQVENVRIPPQKRICPPRSVITSVPFAHTQASEHIKCNLQKTVIVHHGRPQGRARASRSPRRWRPRPSTSRGGTTSTPPWRPGRLVGGRTRQFECSPRRFLKVSSAVFFWGGGVSSYSAWICEVKMLTLESARFQVPPPPPKGNMCLDQSLARLKVISRLKGISYKFGECIFEK